MNGNDVGINPLPALLRGDNAPCHETDLQARRSQGSAERSQVGTGIYRRNRNLHLDVRDYTLSRRTHLYVVHPPTYGTGAVMRDNLLQLTFVIIALASATLGFSEKAGQRRYIKNSDYLRQLLHVSDQQ